MHLFVQYSIDDASRKIPGSHMGMTTNHTEIIR